MSPVPTQTYICFFSEIFEAVSSLVVDDMGKKGLVRSLRILHLSRIKKVPSHLLHIPNSPRPTADWLLSVCKYPKTYSFAVDRGSPENGHGHDPAATLSDVDRFLYDNFPTLYSREEEEGNLSPESPKYDEDLQPTALRSTERFFVSPSTSSALRDEAARPSATSSSTLSPSRSCSSSRATDSGPVVPGGGVAVIRFSEDPYDDFRQSMQDMVEAQHPHEPLDWDLMEELLCCYLQLNDRSVHKHIFRAFTDLTVKLRRGGGESRRVTR